MFDMILYIEVNSDISAHAGRPALSNVGLGNLNYGKRRDRLSHPGPAPEHHATIFWLPVQRDKHNKKLDKRCGP